MVWPNIKIARRTTGAKGPSTNRYCNWVSLSLKSLKKQDIHQVTSDKGQVTSDKWQVTSDKWLVTSDKWQVTSDKRQVTREIRDIIMGLSWGYHGIIMGLSWDYHGIITGVSWDYQRIIMGLSWNILGELVAWVVWNSQMFSLWELSLNCGTGLVQHSLLYQDWPIWSQYFAINNTSFWLVNRAKY